LAPVTEAYDFLLGKINVNSDARFYLELINDKCTLGATSGEWHAMFVDPRRQNIESLIWTVCHETAHLAQFHDGRLRLGEGPADFYWKDKLHQWKYRPAHAGKKRYIYDALPWEVDAEKVGKRLFLKCVKKFKLDEWAYISPYKLTAQKFENTHSVWFLPLELHKNRVGTFFSLDDIN
jgi:hypothetical protein